MSRIRINDLAEGIDLDQPAMADIAGGMDVNVDRLDSSVRSADEGTVSPDVLAAIVTIVIDGLRPRRPL